jgi:hypothetical protein
MPSQECARAIVPEAGGDGKDNFKQDNFNDPQKPLDKAISILNCFSLEKSVWGAGEIAHATGQMKSTAS